MGVDDKRLHRRQMRGGDVEHVGTVGGERARADRAGDHAGEVQHLDAGERTIAGRERLRRRVADLFDGEQRQARHRAALRMGVPFGERARRGDDEAGYGGRVLQLERLPTIDGTLHRGAVIVGAKEFQCAGAVMRQVGVQPDPAAVAGTIDADGLVAMLMRQLAVDAQVALAAKFDAGVAHVDADALPAAGAQMPQFVGGESCGGNGRLRHGADRERGRQGRFRAGQGDRLQTGLRLVGGSPQISKNFLGRGRSAHRRRS